MKYLYEYSDILNSPYEAFLYDTAVTEFPVRPHWHHYVELLYIIDGSIMADNNGKEFYLNPDDMILFHQGDVHSMYSVSNRPSRFVVIKFDIGRLVINATATPKLAYILNKVRKSDENNVYFPAGDNIERGLKEHFERLIREMEQKEIGYDVRVHSELNIILVEIVRMWKNRGLNLDVSGAAINEDEISLMGILEYMDSHVEDNIRVDALASRCNMSYSHFARRFKEIYGRSCKDQLELLKIEKAEEMLTTTDSSLNEISQNLGFSDCSHFIRVFKKWKGITPGRFRR